MGFSAGKRQNLMAQMAYAVIMLLSAGLVAGQSNSCLSAGTSLVSSCSAFTSTLLSDKGLATAGARPSPSSSP